LRNVLANLLNSPRRADRHIRSEAVTALTTFLTSRSTALSPTEALKLWTGLFYALWMADMPLTQQHLCDSLADLLFILPFDSSRSKLREKTARGVSKEQAVASAKEAAAGVWLEAFWATMAREWARLDVYRLEKFMLLVRRVLGASLRWIQGRTSGDDDATAVQNGHTEMSKVKRKYEWHGGRSDVVLGRLTTWSLRPSEEPDLSGYEYETDLMAKDSPNASLLPNSIPVGLKLHMLDIWVDEFEKVGLLEAEKGTQEWEFLDTVNGLVDRLATESHSAAIKVRSKEALEDERLPWNKKAEEENEDEGSWDGIED
jgi:ribosomal RNA-processing protein 1